jgi:TolB-like protein/Flp pilus assembly protein TadD
MLLDFLRELKRRHVIRVGIAYAVVGFIVIQAADLLLRALQQPDWAYTLVVVLVLLGFPIALVLAWAYDITPEGVKHASDLETPPPFSPEHEAVPVAQRSAPPEDRRRIAILPFVNISPDSRDEYFVDGMTEEMIATLSKIGTFEVIARTSVLRYKASAASIAEIRRDLRVGWVLEGSVRKAEGKLRITVQLVDAQHESTLWAHNFDRELHEIFAVQSEIARSVADALEVRLLPREERRLARSPTDNFEAYDLYLLGRNQLGKRTGDGIRKAIAYFELSVRTDPDFAPAHAGIADACAVGAVGYQAMAPTDAVPKAKDAVARALALDPSLPEGHTSLGYIQLYYDWDVEAAKRAFQRAVELNPSHVQAHQWYAHALIAQGAYEEARTSFEHARRLDPLSTLLRTEAIWPDLYTAQWDQAIEELRKVLETEPDFALAHFNLGACYEGKGRLPDAIQHYERGRDLSGGSPFMGAFLAAALARMGRTKEARAILHTLMDQQKESFGFALNIAIVHEALGDKEAAYVWLDKALAEKEALMPVVGSTFIPLPSLRTERRFQQLLQTVRQGRRVQSPAGAS